MGLCSVLAGKRVFWHFDLDRTIRNNGAFNFHGKPLSSAADPVVGYIGGGGAQTFLTAQSYNSEWNHDSSIFGCDNGYSYRPVKYFV